MERAASVLQNSYAPYSNIRVASAILCENGSVYLGVNVENSSYGLTICAERAAIASMVTSGCRKPLVVVVVADTEKPIPPCGACRQVIAEFNPNAVVVMYSTKSRELVVKNLAELLPSPFRLGS
ncbi:MAG: cytidine deaminase [Desulfurococcaceae archaeon]|nr:cytidine deaminase [Desulfurococcaceae archaeon]